MTQYTSPIILAIFERRELLETDRRRRAALSPAERGIEYGRAVWEELHAKLSENFGVDRVEYLAYPPELYELEMKTNTERFALETVVTFRAAAQELRRLRDEWMASQPHADELAHFCAEEEARRKTATLELVK